MSEWYENIQIAVNNGAGEINVLYNRHGRSMKLVSGHNQYRNSSDCNMLAAPLPGEKLSLLSSKHETRLKTFHSLKAFDRSHEIFISVLDHWHKVPDDPSKLTRRTRGGMNYGKVIRKIGSGGSDTLIYELNKLLPDPQSGTGKNKLRPAEPMAVKMPRTDKELNDAQIVTLEDLIREARILAAIGRHPNIVRLIDVHVLSKTRIFLFLEMGYGTLEDYKEGKKNSPLKPIQIKKYAIGVLRGIAHMHGRRIYHLDMKPENVIICKGDVPKMIDFGLSKAKILDSKEKMLDEKWHKYGTNGYMPPESWEKDSYSKETDLAQRDAYAVGLIILEALLAPYFNWKILKAGFLENKTTVTNRITYWQKLIYNPSNQKKLDLAGLRVLAAVAVGLIDRSPENRLTVKGALEMLED